MNFQENLSPFLNTRGDVQVSQPLGLRMNSILHEAMRTSYTMGKFSVGDEEPDFRLSSGEEVLVMPDSEGELASAAIEVSSSGKQDEIASSNVLESENKEQESVQQAAPSGVLGLRESVGSGGKNEEADVEKVQQALNQVGYIPRLVVDGVCGNKTNTAIRAYQAGFLSMPDGRVDPRGTTSKKLAARFPYKKPMQTAPRQDSQPVVINVGKVDLLKQSWPQDNYKSLVEYFGKPGENWVKFDTPYPLRLSWKTSTVVKQVRCNKRVVDSLNRIFKAILSHYGSLEEIQKVGLDLFGGCSVKRSIRGGTSWSRHSWGIAIDLNPRPNGLHTPWPGKATMPVEVIEIFEAEGWKSGARAWGRDAMHFQATR